MGTLWPTDEDVSLQHISWVCVDKVWPDLFVSQSLTNCLKKQACSPQGLPTPCDGSPPPCLHSWEPHQSGQAIPNAWDDLSVPALCCLWPIVSPVGKHLGTEARVEESLVQGLMSLPYYLAWPHVEC